MSAPTAAEEATAPIAQKTNGDLGLSSPSAGKVTQASNLWLTGYLPDLTAKVIVVSAGGSAGLLRSSSPRPSTIMDALAQ